MPPTSKSFSRDMHTRIPPRVQQIMAKKLERSLPGYMKQYTGAYMQQNVLHPQVGGTMPSGGTVVAPHAPHALSSSWREQHFQPTNAPQPPVTPQVMPGQPVSSDPYNFITNPTDGAQPKQFSLPGSGSLVSRVVIVAGGLLVLVIIVSVAKSIIVGPPKLGAFVPVAQDQQEIIHLLQGTEQQKNLSEGTNNFIATAQLSVASNQAQLLQYLTLNKYKINNKQLAVKLSANLDNQLTTAAANASFEPTFKTIITSQLNAYLGDLNRAYASTTGKHGRALLTSDYYQAQLLLIQLGANQ